MRDPSSLPSDLFKEVLDYARSDEPNTFWAYNLRLVNRRWRDTLTAGLYSEWTYSGVKYSFNSLLKFLEMTMLNPNLAACVKTLVIGNWDNRGLLKGRRTKIPLKALYFVCDVMDTLSIKPYSDDLKALRKLNRCLLMALILVKLPNVSKLYAYVSEDPMLPWVLQKVLTQQGSDKPRPLRRLREAHFFRQTIEFSAEDAYQYSSHLPSKTIEFFLHLESLETLSLSNLNLEEAAKFITKHPEIPVKDLTLYGVQEHEYTYGHLRKFLNRFRALASFSFYLPVGCKNHPFITNPDIWSALKKHHGSLEAFDIFRDPMSPPCRYDREFECFGSFHSASRLQNLCVRVDDLLERDKDSTNKPGRLTNNLPASLESLTLYTENNSKLALLDVGIQIKELLVSEKFSLLKSITLEDPLNSECLEKRFFSKLCKLVSSVCQRKEVLFDVEFCCNNGMSSNCRLRKGGRCAKLWEKSSFMRHEKK